MLSSELNEMRFRGPPFTFEVLSSALGFADLRLPHQSAQHSFKHTPFYIFFHTPTHFPIHPVFQQKYIDGLLCVRHCVSHWVQWKEKIKQVLCLRGAHRLVEEDES